jgi:tetratricopeptide (TPR) repeat protein
MQGFTRRFQTALQHLNAGRLDAAASVCAGLRETAPDDPAVLQLQATIALREHRPEEALQLIEESLGQRADHVPSLIVAVRAAWQAGELPRAAAAARQAVALAPTLPEPAFLLCRVLLELGDASLSDTMEQAAARFPKHAAEWQDLGAALRRAKQAGMALRAFTRAAAADPASGSAQFARGLLLRDFGLMHQAQVALEKAVELDPTVSGAWFALGLTCEDLSDEAGAAAAYEAALRERPDFAEAAVNLGIARQRLGDMDAAMAAYRCAVRIRPDSFARIAQAATSSATGMLWLDLDAFRRSLEA